MLEVVHILQVYLQIVFILFIDTGFKSIEVADLDGKNNLDVLKIGLNEPRAIAVDPFQGRNHLVHTYLHYLRRFLYGHHLIKLRFGLKHN